MLDLNVEKFILFVFFWIFPNIINRTSYGELYNEPSIEREIGIIWKNWVKKECRFGVDFLALTLFEPLMAYRICSKL